jgi:hypothetical protein
MNHLASALQGQGMYVVAEQMHRQMLEIIKKVLGPEHPHTLMSMINLASTVRGQCYGLGTATARDVT